MVEAASSRLGKFIVFMTERGNDEKRNLLLTQGEFVLQPVPSFPRRRESRMH